MVLIEGFSVAAELHASAWGNCCLFGGSFGVRKATPGPPILAYLGAPYVAPCSSCLSSSL